MGIVLKEVDTQKIFFFVKVIFFLSFSITFSFFPCCRCFSFSLRGCPCGFSSSIHITKKIEKILKKKEKEESRTNKTLPELVRRALIHLCRSSRFHFSFFRICIRLPPAFLPPCYSLPSVFFLLFLFFFFFSFSF